jgi:hypothetical protein
MKTLIEGYRSFPGEHCGSTAMRSLLYHYFDLELPEAAVFGLGAGVDCVVLSAASMDPAVVVFGRSLNMEADLGLALGVDYREQTETDDAKAWDQVRQEVLAGRPTMLSGDIFYLDYREFKVHFPGHRFVLVGFDDEREIAFIADRINAEPEACSYPALFKSRNPPEGISTHNLWGRFHGSEPTRSLEEAAAWAIEHCSRRMLGQETSAADLLAESPDLHIASGIAGIHSLADSLEGWGARDDATWLASYNARCIEKFSNGGGNFRRLYAGFLRWAREVDPALVPASAPDLAWRAADGWTALSANLAAASEGEVAAETWRRAADAAREIAGIETELFESLANSKR